MFCADLYSGRLKQMHIHGFILQSKIHQLLYCAFSLLPSNLKVLEKIIQENKGGINKTSASPTRMVKKIKEGIKTFSGILYIDVEKAFN